MPASGSDLRSRSLLSIQRALVGCVTHEMRFISAEMSQFRIALHVYVDGPFQDGVYEDFDAEAMTQIVADFPYPEKGDPQASCVFHRCDYPAKPIFEGVLVFGRKEEPNQAPDPTAPSGRGSS